MEPISRAVSLVRGYRDWIRRWKTLPVQAWISGAEAYRAGRYQDAELLYRQGLKRHVRHPARVSALLDLSHCLFRLRKFSDAELALRQAISTAPSQREAYVRLARLQLWLGYGTEAAWTIRTCLQRIQPDPEIATIFLTAVVESGGVSYLLREAQELLTTLHIEPEGYPRFQVALARFHLLVGDREDARARLAKLAALDRGPFDGVVTFAEILLSEGKIAYARHHLHRALAVSAEHPRVLTLLARSYLMESPVFDPENAIQLAARACQNTGWRGVHEMHVLARAYALFGDKVSALLVAGRAKDTGRRLLGCYAEAKDLDRLIERLCTGTQA